MADETQGKFQFESQKLLDYMSTPVLLNTESNRLGSRQLQSQTDGSLEQKDVKFQCGISESSFSARQMSEYQLFSVSQAHNSGAFRDQRSHHFRSWHGLMNIQASDGEQNKDHSTKSRMRPLFRSLLTVASLGKHSLVVTETLDNFRTGLSHNLLHAKDTPRDPFNDIHRDPFNDIHRDSFNDIHRDSFNDIHRDSFNDIHRDSFNDIHRDWFWDRPGDSFTDVSCNSLTDIPSDAFKDVTDDSFTGVSSNSSEDVSRFSFRDISDKPGDLYEDTHRDALTDRPRDSYKDTPRNSPKDTPRDSLTDTPSDSPKDTPRDSFTDTPRDSLTDTPRDSPKDTSRDSLKDTHEDVLKDTLRDSLKDTLRDSFKDTSTDSFKDTPSNYYSDISRNHRATKSEHNFHVKLRTETDEHTSAYFETEHQLLETTASLIQQEKLSTDKQQTSVHLSTGLSFLGILANYLFIGPLVVVYWNSTWSFLDYVLLSHGCPTSVWASAALGFPIMATVTLLQGSLLSYSSRCNRLVRFIVSRTYTYIVSIVCVSQWRSVWIVADCYVGTSLLNSAVTFAAAFLVLGLSRRLKNTSAPPVSIPMDVPHSGQYKVATFRGSTPTWSLNGLLDTVVTVFVMQVFVILYWRTVWEILDFCLIPEDKHLSGICSVGIGVGLSCVLLILHRPITELSGYLRAKNWSLMLIFQDLVTVLYSVVCISYWRGLWMLLDLYTPFRPNSLYIAHGVSFVILMVCLAANCLLVRDVARDCGSGVVFDAHYVTTVIQTLRHKTDSNYRTDLVLKRIQYPDDADYL